MNVLSKGDLTSLTWIQLPNDGPDEAMEIQVHYAALNFRDVMLASGRLSTDTVPGSIVGLFTLDLFIFSA